MPGGSPPAIDEHVLAVLRPLVDSARVTLSELEADDVPASLRRITKSSARSLPPPFARSVVKALVSDSSLRSAVADQYAEGGNRDEDLVLFLDDPDAGLARIAGRAATAREQSEQSAQVTALASMQLLEERLTESKRRTAKLRELHAAELLEARSAASAEHVRAQDRIRKLTRELQEREATIRGLESRVEELMAEVAATTGRLGAVLDRQQRRAAAAPQPGAEGRSDATPSDAVDLARWLDDVERHIRPYRHTSGTQAVGHDRVFALGAGIPPDGGRAIDDLIDRGPHRFILDGYNIGAEIDVATFSTRSGRDGVIARAGRLARSTDARVVVVFDGPDDDGRESFRTTTGVVVEFSKGQKADDRIVDLVAGDPDRTVVITNDRELQDRCSTEGCVAIWSTAFIDW